MNRDIEQYAKDYLELDFEHIMLEHRRKIVLEILNHYHPKRILEIGCGCNSIFEFYSDFAKAVVVEPAEKLIVAAKQNLKQNEKVEFIHGFLEDIATAALQTFKFDFILCSGLLHEVEDPNRLLKSIHKLCSDETIVHVNVPNANSFHLLWAEEAGLISSRMDMTEQAVKLQQKTKFDSVVLKRMLKANGFSTLKIATYYLKLFNHSKMKLALSTGMIDRALDEALDSMIRYCPKNGAELYANCKKRD